MEQVKAFLTKEVGPVAMWVWLAAAGAAYFLFFNKKGRRRRSF